MRETPVLLPSLLTSDNFLRDRLTKVSLSPIIRVQSRETDIKKGVNTMREQLIIARGLLLLLETLESVKDVTDREPSDIADIKAMLALPQYARWVPVLQYCECPINHLTNEYK